MEYIEKCSDLVINGSATISELVDNLLEAAPDLREDAKKFIDTNKEIDDGEETELAQKVKLYENQINDLEIKRDALKALKNQEPDLEQKNHITFLTNELKEDKKEIKILKKQLDEQLKELNEEMNSFRVTLEKQNGNKELHAHVKIASQLLAMQTEMAGKKGFLPKLTPSQELTYQLLFDHVLGCVTEINCKSGLDRTGFTRSLHNAIQQKMKAEKLKHVLEFMTKFENRVKEMDKQVLEDVNFDLESGEYKAEYAFQRDVFAELMGVARPITGRSSGVEGLKWHHDKKSLNPYEKNPHPLRYLPIHVQIGDGDGDKKVTVIEFNKKEKRKLSKEGNELLMGLSSHRGG